jgi:hypothetical protein
VTIPLRLGFGLPGGAELIEITVGFGIGIGIAVGVGIKPEPT